MRLTFRVAMHSCPIPSSTRTFPDIRFSAALIIYSGLDLEVVAYEQTNHLEGMVDRGPPLGDLVWKLVGCAGSLTGYHLDITNTRVDVQADEMDPNGGKRWFISRPRPRAAMAGEGVDLRYGILDDSYAYHHIDFTRANIDWFDFEGLALPPGHGTL